MSDRHVNYEFIHSILDTKQEKVSPLLLMTLFVVLENIKQKYFCIKFMWHVVYFIAGRFTPPHRPVIRSRYVWWAVESM
jgi:hypothetical protein